MTLCITRSRVIIHLYSSGTNNLLYGFIMIEITEEYKQVLDLINVKTTPIFVTGGAGSGKSTLISYIQENYRNVVTVAPTGIAALNVNGSTIHSTFRMPPKFILPFDKKQLRGNSVLANADIIIIDEISMVNANMLDTMEYIMRISKQSKVAFGGTPVVMFGDLYQLPPVVTDETRKLFTENYDTPYFFSANCLKRASMRTVKLTRVFRQKDITFVNVLNNIRMGTDVEASLEYINSNVRFIDKAEKGCIVVTTTNRKCNEINNFHLRRIKLEEHTFMGKIEGKFNPSSIPVDSIVDLKVGTQVMVAKNIEGAVNGTLGIVTAIHNNNVHVKTNDDELLNISKVVWESVKYTTRGKKVEKDVVGSYTQIPLKLAWAITVHKGQGQTMNNIHIDMDTGAFASGQIYVALSRCTTLEGITLSRPLYTSDIIVDDDVREFYNNVSSVC